MERLKHPEDRTDNYPSFYCSSISDMAASRDAMIEGMLAWVKNEARSIDRLSYRVTDGLNRVSSRISGKKVMPVVFDIVVELPLITHYPAFDEGLKLPGNQILIKDPTDQCVVDLPSEGDLTGINFFRIREGLPWLDLGTMRDRSWTGDIVLSNRYSSTGDRFRIINLREIKMEESVRAGETVVIRSHLVTTQGI
ncbi:MAG: hypothetical protein A3J18_03115 [Candidatus Levybacteria bacterium RIFCSPLOWO2_02_FULL_40_18]|nr:MAG: hypothetical protein A3D82_01510 [Candidatus Levybacteria bacterium RIFCSPHIGHO2_02_FULL_40_29]OGH32701.1 MAG: hypothetical protein A3E70_03970 [Candidatus Levybacteria bacterium RIFCSPHIGHO2_12_FULL_40_44]OGH49746.1 MAG: hypothetical protein A3J18_03115 [Candidatus Levybacteria bacterium RIFCSPLOWO2_02_FULL_40_18]OGH51969.1 MAG: hypothetical protein A3H20_01280 [Candidatus Levybacteria bacterium RIFCSPLOWO2_12_FULL_41_12]OGH54639.1 MAG: hypothetical protein A2596_00390 [Candidatus Levy